MRAALSVALFVGAAIETGVLTNHRSSGGSAGRKRARGGDAVAPCVALALLDGELGAPVLQALGGDADFDLAAAFGLQHSRYGDGDGGADQPSIDGGLGGEEAGAGGDPVAPAVAFALLKGELGAPVLQALRGDADFNLAGALGLRGHRGGADGGGDQPGGRW